MWAGKGGGGKRGRERRGENVTPACLPMPVPSNIINPVGLSHPLFGISMTSPISSQVAWTIDMLVIHLLPAGRGADAAWARYGLTFTT